MLTETERLETTTETEVTGPPQKVVLPQMASVRRTTSDGFWAVLGRLFAGLGQAGQSEPTVHERPRRGFD